MTTAAQRLDEIVQKCADALRDANGRLRKPELHAAVRAELGRDDLALDIRAAALDGAAADAVTKFGDKRNPRRRKRGSLFHPEDYLKLGNGIWVRMKDATDTDVQMWSRMSRRNRSRVDEADTELQDYADSRLDAFRDHGGITNLLDLERIVFGWSEDDAEQPGLFDA